MFIGIGKSDECGFLDSLRSLGMTSGLDECGYLDPLRRSD
jgi:hypothetical protein